MFDRALFRKSYGFVLLLMLAVSEGRPADSLIPVTSQAQQGANDSMSWLQLGADQTVLGQYFNAFSAGGVLDSVALAGSNSVIVVVCPASPCNWTGGTGLTAGGSLIWTSDAGNGGNGPLTVGFGISVAGAGALIQANAPGQFTAQIEAFHGASSLGSFSVTSDPTGDAVYIGVSDQTGRNITAVAFSLVSCGTIDGVSDSNCNVADFGVDTVMINAPPPSFPAPTLALPSDGATGVSLTPTLSWNSVSGTAGYSVYLGTTNPPPIMALTGITSYTPTNPLSPATTYYWTIASRDPNNGNAESKAPIRSFVTATSSLPAPALMVPADGATGVLLTPTLIWNPVSGTAGYSVYLGTTNPPPSMTLTGITSYTPSGSLTPGTTYYWTVASRDPNNGNAESKAPVRSFVTGTSSFPAPTLVLPSDGATGVPLTPTLSWNSVPTSAGYSVYLGTANPPPVVLLTAATGYTPTTSLNASTTYFWTVSSRDPNNGNAESKAPVRSFSTVTTVPAVNLSPSSLTFAAQAVGTSSAAQTVTLTNTGNAPLTVRAISTGTDFPQSNPCIGNLNAGAHCTISVTFSPQAAGARTDTLYVYDNASDSPQRVALSGTGITPTPIASLSVPSLTFGSEVVATSSAAQTVTVTNTGTAPLNFSSIVAGGDFALDASGTTCSTSTQLGLSATCAIAIVFTPAATGTRTGTLTLTDDAGTQTVALSGTGIAPGASLDPSSLTFGSQVVGAVGPAQTATLTNTGTSALNLSAISASGDFAETHTCGTLPAAIAPGSSCAISITFTPTATGVRTGLVTVTDDASGGEQTLALTGTGTAPGVALTPSTVSFSALPVGTSSAAQSVMLANSGTSDLNVTAIATSGDFAQSNSCGTLPAVVAAGGSCTIDVKFTPTAVGARTGTIVITDDAASSPQTVSLTGSGVVPAPSIAPASLSFVAQGLGSASSAKVVTLTNSSSVSVSISTASVTGANAGDFATSADTCSGATVAAGDNCSVSVTFTPSAIGARSATLSFADNAFGTPQTVALTGTGAPPTLTITANDASRVYGAANPTFAATYSGFIHDDTPSSLSGTLSCTTTATTSSAAGTYPITCSGQSSANYNITYVAGTLTVTTAALTITANGATRTYGAANPAFTAVYSGFVNGDTANALSGTLACTTTATTASAAGAFPITCSGQSSTNYTITYVPGTLTVTTAPLTITANNATRIYGAANSAFTVVYSGFVNGDTAKALSGTLSCVTSATVASAVGTYPITCSGQTSTNYSITYSGGTLTVTPTALSITANNATRTYGAANPYFKAAYSGFVNGDTETSLSGMLSCSTTATTLSDAGTYQIICSGQSSTNYAISYVAGVLTVNKASPAFSGLTASQSISFGVATVTLGGRIAAGALIPTGENASITLNGVTQSAAIGAFGSFATTFSTDSLASSSAAYLITYNYASDANFNSASDASTGLTVTPGFSGPPPTDPSTKQTVAAGQPANFSLSFTASGMSGTLTFACSGAPVGATCIPPGPQTLNSGSSVTATVTVTTTAHVQSTPAGKERRWFGGWPRDVPLRWPVGPFLTVMLALACFTLTRSRRRAWALLGACVLLISGWVACGSGGNNGGGNGGPPPAPSVSLSASSLAFNSQNQGTTSAAQTVTLTNTGNAALSITGLNVGGTNPSDFALASSGTTCSTGTTVPANVRCAMNITFSPIDSGPRAGTVTIFDNASPNQQTVVLSGTGVPPVTPPGVYSLTVTATLTTSTGTVSHTLPLTLTVK